MTETFGPLSPALVLIAAGLILPLLKEPLRNALFLLAPAIALALVWMLPLGPGLVVDWLGLHLVPIAADGFSRIFGTAFGIAALAGALYGVTQPSATEKAAALVYAGAAQGIAFSGDLLTLFVFWEILAIGSTLVIWSNGNARAGLRYALIHVLGGVLLFAGIAAEIAGSGSLSLQAMRADSVGRWLMLAGILVNAGALPLSAWVADAYPKASWSGAVFLSAFTTKAAVLVLIRLFPGEPALLWIGLAMAVYGLVYALLENDIRKLLSYSIVGQVGFMVVAVGIGSPLALAAAALHALAHILYKSLLMMAAGSILRATGETRLTGLGGLARAMPETAAAMLVGGLSLAAMPLTAGFVSKSAIMAALAADQAGFYWFALTAVSAGSFLYIGLKLPFFALSGPERARVEIQPTRSMRAAMGALCLLLVASGCFPGWLETLAPEIAGVPILTADHILFQLQMLVGASCIFAFLLPLLRPSLGFTLDVDWLWRELPHRAAPRWRRVRGLFDKAGADFRAEARRSWGSFSQRSILRLGAAGNWPTGKIAFWATALLAIYVLIAAL
ncbi:proton-conducting transporter membrane subunit [Kaistia nematophila]|uniref:Proton-conducting transporter membrane subunit n=1 Tax=Kaistia nematophila TaxID=2994654 RepID=A0A9X3E5D9_9HYPH|nr:proton-conducting transporter membrane subunit [Kaistia nematophila]MCX5572169.1 proton-conducting transporter membrane subunit [Kaistia nematophila]